MELMPYNVLLLQTFAKFWRRTISFVIPVCPSAHMEHLAFHWTDFHDILYLCILRKFIKWKLRHNLTRIAVILHEGRYAFLIISRRILLRMRNVSDKNSTEIQNTHFILSNFSPKSSQLWDNVEKLCRAGHATDDNITHAHYVHT